MTRQNLGFGPGLQAPEMHHIFPSAYLLGRHYDKKEVDRALNMTFLLAATNNFINDRPRSVYINDLIGRRATADNIDIDAARKRVKALLAQHFLDDETFEALVSDDYERFLSERARALRTHLRDADEEGAPDADPDLSLVEGLVG
jgi:hypothetical protein